MPTPSHRQHMQPPLTPRPATAPQQQARQRHQGAEKRRGSHRHTHHRAITRRGADACSCAHAPCAGHTQRNPTRARPRVCAAVRIACRQCHTRCPCAPVQAPRPRQAGQKTPRLAAQQHMASLRGAAPTNHHATIPCHRCPHSPLAPVDPRPHPPLAPMPLAPRNTQPSACCCCGAGAASERTSD